MLADSLGVMGTLHYHEQYLENCSYIQYLMVLVNKSSIFCVFAAGSRFFQNQRVALQHQKWTRASSCTCQVSTSAGENVWCSRTLVPYHPHETLAVEYFSSLKGCKACSVLKFVPNHAINKWQRWKSNLDLAFSKDWTLLLQENQFLLRKFSCHKDISSRESTVCGIRDLLLHTLFHLVYKWSYSYQACWPKSQTVEKTEHTPWGCSHWRCWNQVLSTAALAHVFFIAWHCTVEILRFQVLHYPSYTCCRRLDMLCFVNLVLLFA